MSYETCGFCKRIANGDYEHGNARAVAFRPRGGGVVEGHIMVVPRMHVDRFDSFPGITAVAAAYAAELAGLLYGEDGFNIIVNSGAAAGQTLFHLHFHILPRRYGDKVTMPWPDNRPMPDVFDEVTHQEDRP